MEIEDYILQVKNKQYEPLLEFLYNEISEEGFLDELREYYNKSYTIKDFEYIDLEISEEDKEGLMDFDDTIIDKFNDFDIALKDLDKGTYPRVVDFIDYDRGKVVVVKLKGILESKLFKFSSILESTVNSNIKIVSGQMSQQEMARKFPDFTYALRYGFLTYVPIDLIRGLDPSPSNWYDDEGEVRDFEKGEKIPDNKPIEVIWDFMGDNSNDPNDYEFYMQNGNHRIKQAKLNGDSHILALVEPKNKNLFLSNF